MLLVWLVVIQTTTTRGAGHCNLFKRPQIQPRAQGSGHCVKAVQIACRNPFSPFRPLSYHIAAAKRQARLHYTRFTLFYYVISVLPKSSPIYAPMFAVAQTVLPSASFSVSFWRFSLRCGVALSFQRCEPWVYQVLLLCARYCDRVNF